MENRPDASIVHCVRTLVRALSDCSGQETGDDRDENRRIVRQSMVDNGVPKDIAGLLTPDEEISDVEIALLNSDPTYRAWRWAASYAVDYLKQKYQLPDNGG